MSTVTELLSSVLIAYALQNVNVLERENIIHFTLSIRDNLSILHTDLMVFLQHLCEAMHDVDSFIHYLNVFINLCVEFESPRTLLDTLTRIRLLLPNESDTNAQIKASSGEADVLLMDENDPVHRDYLESPLLTPVVVTLEKNSSLAMLLRYVFCRLDAGQFSAISQIHDQLTDLRNELEFVRNCIELVKSYSSPVSEYRANDSSPSKYVSNAYIRSDKPFYPTSIMRPFWKEMSLSSPAAYVNNRLFSKHNNDVSALESSSLLANITTPRDLRHTMMEAMKRLDSSLAIEAALKYLECGYGASLAGNTPFDGVSTSLALSSMVSEKNARVTPSGQFEEFVRNFFHSDPSKNNSIQMRASELHAVNGIGVGEGIGPLLPLESPSSSGVFSLVREFIISAISAPPAAGAALRKSQTALMLLTLAKMHTDSMNFQEASRLLDEASSVAQSLCDVACSGHIMRARAAVIALRHWLAQNNGLFASNDVRKDGKTEHVEGLTFSYLLRTSRRFVLPTESVEELMRARDRANSLGLWSLQADCSLELMRNLFRVKLASKCNKRTGMKNQIIYTPSDRKESVSDGATHSVRRERKDMTLFATFDRITSDEAAYFSSATSALENQRDITPMVPDWISVDPFTSYRIGGWNLGQVVSTSNIYDSYVTSVPANPFISSVSVEGTGGSLLTAITGQSAAEQSQVFSRMGGSSSTEASASVVMRARSLGLNGRQSLWSAAVPFSAEEVIRIQKEGHELRTAIFDQLVENSYSMPTSAGKAQVMVGFLLGQLSRAASNFAEKGEY